MNVNVAEKRPIESLPDFSRDVRRIEQELNGRGAGADPI